MWQHANNHTFDALPSLQKTLVRMQLLATLKQIKQSSALLKARGMSIDAILTPELLMKLEALHGALE